MRTREEHLARCKERALEYVERHELAEGLTSMCSDLTKHPETKDHPGIDIGVNLLFIGSLSSREKMRRFIEGFH